MKLFLAGVVLCAFAFVVFGRFFLKFMRALSFTVGFCSLALWTYSSYSAKITGTSANILLFGYDPLVFALLGLPIGIFCALVLKFFFSKK
ncbi:MAG: hypothetical protein A2745_03580 [Candidatus Harrisonbacteria bacterium RIFCSPHIGHO2_01_FULL_44_13]|uniref:Uncharacterized protein n=1 Tax=Candidatus Harrisonbacteria bacterium RIFCSPLOWO2_01_FULL_44_18 TaxID=1798407 RepID=A0A1G1ZMB5_9BACT|nr:MAG: hypothetical protein A2745_03580 [Candidatus Harrisonbacteria bacterium RIFCSPHIGHO2_01_FULL_44_13]OGY65266.1 MAG: hypothetical protein A3A16_01945 [Candidatus Harrisonbacteria bacterium RIFCSPLOWO2_01_FULL_44_18]